MTYEELARRLTPEAEQLFREMVAAHIEAGSGDRRFIRADSMGGCHMIFQGNGFKRSWDKLDAGSVEDLVSYGLLHLGFGGRGSPNYRVGGEALAFHRWLMSSRGTPITQVDVVVREFVSGDAFAGRHPGAAHHLGEAFNLMWSGVTTDQAASEIGDHLRKAVMDLASDLAPTGASESPIASLRRRLAEEQKVSARESAVLERLVDLADAVLRLDHRLNHIRDENDKDLPLRNGDEIRRAAFSTAFACFELSRAFD